MGTGCHPDSDKTGFGLYIGEPDGIIVPGLVYKKVVSKWLPQCRIRNFIVSEMNKISIDRGHRKLNSKGSGIRLPPTYFNCVHIFFFAQVNNYPLRMIPGF